MTPIIITYTNTILEIKRGRSLFWRKYRLKRMIPMTLAFLITLALGINIMISGTGFFGHVAAALSAYMLITMWSQPIIAGRKLIATLQTMNEELYEARFYDDRIEIDTVILPEQPTEAVVLTADGFVPLGDDVLADNPHLFEAPPSEKGATPAETTVINFQQELFSVEDNELLCLFVNRALIYIFPKRCLSEQQTTELKQYFEDKGI